MATATRTMYEFDEDFYLRHNPDVAQAVAQGEWPSGFMHWCTAGKAEGRKAAPPVDAEWYVSSYPRAALEIALGRAVTADEHYFRLGRFRGYLPSPGASRSSSPAAHRSRAGGFWTDLGNALDIIDGRAAIGEFTPSQVSRLTDWVTAGYVVLDGAVLPQVVELARQELADCFAGVRSGARIAGADAEAPVKPDDLLDPHWLAAAVRDALLAAPVVAFMQQVFQRQVLLAASVGSGRANGSEVAQLGVQWGSSLPNQFVGVDVALCDHDIETGPAIVVYPGSHRIAEFWYANSAKSVPESRRLGMTGALEKRKARYRQLIDRQIAGLDLKPCPVYLKRGDVLVSCPDLLTMNPGAVTGAQHQRLSSCCCPVDAAPAYFEQHRDVSIRRHVDRAFYSSAVYGGPTGP